MADGGREPASAAMPRKAIRFRSPGIGCATVIGPAASLLLPPESVPAPLVRADWEGGRSHGPGFIQCWAHQQLPEAAQLDLAGRGRQGRAGGGAGHSARYAA